jgi:uncharacterized membrane protein YgcG
LLTACAAATVIVLSVSVPARAGCGCQKPPPPLAQIRPAFASLGDELSIFVPNAVAGRIYTVVFKSRTGATRSVSATTTMRRDFADAAYKPQLVVSAPDMMPGPTTVIVKDGSTPVLMIPHDQFTMLQAPLALAEADAVTMAECYRAAVGGDGTVYIPLDISAISDHMLFSGLGMTYPLLFAAEDIAIYNTQGVLMQLLGPAQADIFAIQDPLGAPHSFELMYDRHEFNTYREAHLHEGGYGLDPTDPRWHVDGTRHVDHDRLVVAVRGIVENQGLPVPGVTPLFTLDIMTMLPDGPGGPITSTTMQWSAECSASDSGGGSSGSGGSDSGSGSGGSGSSGSGSGGD